MENKNENSIESKLNKLPSDIQEKVRELAGLPKRRSFKISPFERRVDKWFDCIKFLVAIIAPWALLIWAGIDIDIALLGAVAGIWSFHMILEWARWDQRKEKLETKMYGEVEDDKGKEE